MLRFLAGLIFLAFSFAAPAMAQPLPGERQVEGSLHAARAAVAPGETFTIVLRQNIREHWHTYWINPGDSGEPTELTWAAPQGWEIGPIQWPTPQAIPFAMLVNFGYEGEVLFPIEVTAPANAPVGSTVTLPVNAYWLVCSDICIPEEMDLTLDVAIAAQGRDDPQWAPRIAEAVAALPSNAQRVDARITSGAPARLSVALPNARELRNLRFFAFDRDVMRAGEAQSARVGAGGASFNLTPGVANNLGAVPLAGVVAYEAQDGGAWVLRGVEIEATPGEVIAGTDEIAAQISDDYKLSELEGGGAAPAVTVEPLSAVALIAALGLAFLGGLILNIMPCVLPVLSVKALSFAGGAQNGEARKHGALYFAGVMVTFLALAGVLIALRGAGEAVGWGFQLQAPWVTSALALLFFVIGLNLLSVFEFGGSLQNAGSGLATRGGDAGAFFTGALAVIAATPCTAPFMAGAIGAALTQSAGVTLLIFAALGLGFALPLTLLHFLPGLQKLVPKPGPWMERAKNVLAFPMFGAAVWLVWVLAEQTGSAGVMALLSVAAALAFALFVARWGRVWLAIGAVALVVTGALMWRPLVGAQTQSVLVSEAWSPERVAELQGEGRGVFVNFTAAWCVTCKVNEATSLATPRVAQALAEANVAYLVGDWTNRDETIAGELAAHGRAGVPLYLFYPADGGAPQVLPQMLSQDLILQTIQGETE
ncbi:protein-disulfide reductase DsbD family protein [Vitreimonas flagellata]|uniref:protein-disulfide reductase DsbD family protein n=1 Tax=Vitreimonas flagellata TaxID=2560861 RepID=UPI001430B5B0|nr:protein-disulfide reductase DsbD domain-containing protein [Vitreimonas flagellata]